MKRFALLLLVLSLFALNGCPKPAAPPTPAPAPTPGGGDTSVNQTVSPAGTDPIIQAPLPETEPPKAEEPQAEAPAPVAE